MQTSPPCAVAVPCSRPWSAGLDLPLRPAHQRRRPVASRWSPSGPSAASCEAVLLTPTDAEATGAATYREAGRVPVRLEFRGARYRLRPVEILQGGRSGRNVPGALEALRLPGVQPSRGRAL